MMDDLTVFGLGNFLRGKSYKATSSAIILTSDFCIITSLAL